MKNNRIILLLSALMAATVAPAQEPGTQRWTPFTTGGQVWSSPALGPDGTIFIGSDDRKLYALNGQTGAKLWESLPTGNFIQSSPTISDGRVYFGSVDNKVYALNAATGELVWDFLTGGPVVSSPAIGVNGTIYIGSNDRKLYALNSVTGAKQWEFPAAGRLESSPAIGPDGTIYVGSTDYFEGVSITDGKVYAIDSDGNQRWAVQTPGSVYSSPAIGTNQTLFVGWKQKFHFGEPQFQAGVCALDTATGAERWKVSLDQQIWSSPVIAADGTIYVGGFDATAGKVYALNPVDGATLWTFTTAGEVDGSAALGADGTVYVGSRGGYLYAINPLNGAQLWRFPADNPINSINSSPAIAPDGTVYFGSWDKKVYAVWSGSAGLLTTSAWPKFRSSARNLGVFNLPDHRLEFSGAMTGWVQGHQIAPPGEGPLIQYAYQRIYGKGTGPNAEQATAAQGTQVAAGFNHLQTVIADQEVAVADLAIQFGPFNAAFDKTWNLGNDIRGEDWNFDSATFVEERFYRANPEDVFIRLYYQDQPIVDFSYSDLNMRLDFMKGEIVGSTGTLAPARMPDLNGVALQLANAFLADVRGARGALQILFVVDSDPLTQQDFTFEDQPGAHFEGASTLQIIPNVVAPRAPVLALEPGLESWSLSVSGNLGETIELEHSSSLSPADWEIFQTLILTSDPQTVPLASPEGTEGFWRARVP